MKKIMMLAAALMLTAYAHTASAADNTIRPILGFKSSAANFGVDYEKRMNHDMGWGAYFMYGSEHKDNNATNQVVSLGVMAPIHVVDNGALDLYIAPGFGIAMVKGISPQDDETTLGPSYKLGAEWKFTSTVKAGVQYMTVYNWFTDKAAAEFRYASASVGIAF